MAKRIICAVLALIFIIVPALGGTTFAAGTDEVEAYVYDFLINDLGVNIAAACGILANIYGESRFIPTASVIDVDGYESYGLCQWHVSRLEALKSFCAANGYDYTTAAGQMQYLKYELNNDEKYAYSKILGLPNTADGAYTAGYNWCKYFGRGADIYASRGNIAKCMFWPKYGAGASEVVYATVADGIYYIKNNSESKYLTVPSHKQENGTDVGIDTLSVNNYFKISVTKGEWGYILKPLYTSNSVVNIYATIVSAGKRVTLYSTTGDSSQQWNFRLVDGGFVIHSAQKPKYVMDLYHPETDPYSWFVNVNDYAEGAQSQVWTLIPVDPPAAAVPTVEAGNSAEPTVISWQSVQNADGYEVLIKNTANNSTVINTPTNELSYSIILPEGNYTVTLTSVNSMLADAGNYKTVGTPVAFSVEKSHVHDFSGRTEVITDSTCSAEGLMKVYCTGADCGEYITVAIPAKEHTLTTVLTPPTATADGSISMVCTVCGHTNVIQVLPAACQNMPTINVAEIEVPAGRQVTLPITLDNAQGIKSVSFSILYDESCVELISVSTIDKNVKNLSTFENSVYFEIANCTVQKDTINCTFYVKDGASGEVSVGVSYGPTSIYNDEYDNVYPAVSAGKITIVPLLKFYGDANRDGKVTIKDVLLMRRYLSSLVDIEDIDTVRADVDGSGKITQADVLYLRKFLSNIIPKLPLE